MPSGIFFSLNCNCSSNYRYMEMIFCQQNVRSNKKNRIDSIVKCRKDSKHASNLKQISSSCNKKCNRS